MALDIRTFTRKFNLLDNSFLLMAYVSQTNYIILSGIDRINDWMVH